MIKRQITENIIKRLNTKKVVIIYGARQTGKTTLLKYIYNLYSNESIFLNCDEPSVREQLTNVNSVNLKQLVGNKKYVFIDEAQRIKNIGITLKLFVDELPDKKILASGSSAFELANQIKEPLTGRKFEFILYPFSLNELINEYGKIELDMNLENRIIFGMYPEIVTDVENSKENLRLISESYLYKDILTFREMRKPEILQSLVRALALQIGNQVSYAELSKLLKIDQTTVQKYIDLLEKSFVIFRLNSFSKNVRTELKKTRKIYFYDTGIRNALIDNFQPLELRADKGALWENFLISELIKKSANIRDFSKFYFWRTKLQQEIDLIQENENGLFGYEFKWNKNSKVKIPLTFTKAYPDARIKIIDVNNFYELFQ